MFKRSTDIQTLLFDTDGFTLKGAKRWARSHGFRYGGADEGERTIRIRQHDPDEYQPGTFRTIELTDYVKAVVGVPKRSAERADGYNSRGPAHNPVSKYRGVSYTATAGVYRAHLPGGTEVFGHARGGKRGMQAFIDQIVRTPKRNPKGAPVEGMPGWRGFVQTSPGRFVDYEMAITPRRSVAIHTGRVSGASALHYDARLQGVRFGSGHAGVVGLGRYPTRQAAQETAESAAAKLRPLPARMWPRSYGELEAILRA